MQDAENERGEAEGQMQRDGCCSLDLVPKYLKLLSRFLLRTL